MVETGGEAHVATPTMVAQVDGQQPDKLNDYLHQVNGLRPKDGGHAGFNPDNLTLTGLDPLKQAKPPAADTSKLPPVTIGPTEKQGGVAGAVKQFDPPPVDNESTLSKLGRETEVIGGGLGRSVLYGMASLPERLPELGMQVGIGATLSGIAKSGEFGAAATIFVGGVFTARYVVNAINDTGRWQKMSSSVSDAWHSDKNTMKDMKDFSDSGGNFAFDTALGYGAGYLGYKNKALADIILGGIGIPTPVVVPGIPPKLPLSPQLMGASMYLSIAPAPYLYKSHLEDFSDKPKADSK